jgi:hypothetical protein
MQRSGLSVSCDNRRYKPGFYFYYRGHEFDTVLSAPRLPATNCKTKSIFEAVCQKDCEGSVAKHRLAPYASKPQTWFKVLNPGYT